MPTLTYTARTLDGVLTAGRIRADDEQSARNSLFEKGLEPLSIQPLDAPQWSLSFPRLFRRVNTKTLVTVTGQIALMLKTGTSIVESLKALAEQTSGDTVSDVLSSVVDEVSGGASLGDALSEHPDVFGDFYISAVKAGEMTGELAETFERLQLHLQKRLNSRNNIITALIYPAIVTVLAIGAVTFLVTFVLPKFVDIFQKNNVALPLPTRMLMGTSTILTTYWYVLLALGIVLPIVTFLYVKSPRGSLVVDRLILRMPLLGSLTNLVQSSALLRSLGTLLGAGVPLIESLAVAQDVCKNKIFKAFVGEASTGVLQGETLTSSFVSSPLISPTIKQMVATGERSGNLALVMNSVSEHLDEAADKQMKRLSALFEPMVIVVMGIAVGFIAVSLLLPLFRLTSAVKGAQ